MTLCDFLAALISARLSAFLPPSLNTAKRSMASTSGAQDNNAPAGGAAAFLAGFQLVRVLSQDAKTRSAALLGTLPAQGDGETVNNGGGEREQAIVLLEKTHFEDSFYSTLGETEGAEEGNGRAAALEDGRRETKKVKLDRTDGAEDGRHDTTASSTLSTSIQLRNLSDIQSLGHNDIYTWLLARIGSSFVTSPPDVKLTLIRPATSSHIEKHSAQEKIMVYETPQMYSEKTLPWISAQDPKRIQWVYNILEGKKEQENVVYRDEDPMMGFVVSRGAASLFFVALSSTIDVFPLPRMHSSCPTSSGIARRSHHSISKPLFRTDLCAPFAISHPLTVRCFARFAAWHRKS